MTNPIDPNFKPGVGRLVTDRYDFQTHINGTGLNHLANQIILSPPVTVGVTVISDVQTAIAALSGTIIVPTVPDATTSSKGIIQLGGDLSGLNTSAAHPTLGSLQGTLLSISAPTTNQVLQWNGTAWVNAAIVPATTALLGTIQLSAGAGPSAGDIGNTATVPRVIGLQGQPVSNATPTSGQVLVFSAGTWQPGSASGTPAATGSALGTVQLAGDLNGSGSVATAPRVGSLNGAVVPAGTGLTTGHVLQVNGGSSLTYGFVADANVSVTAAIAGTKISPNFGSQNLATTGTGALGATTITGALAAGAGTAFNTLTGAMQYTTRTVTASFTVDTTTTDHIIFCRTLSSAITITLPTASNGRKIIVKDSEGNALSNNITITPPGAAKIEGLNVSKVLANSWGSWTFVSNGTDWFMV